MYFLLNLSHCVKSYGHLCQIYQNPSLNMVMLRDPGLKFVKFLFFDQFCIKFRKSYQIWGKLAQQRKRYRQKTKEGGEHPPSACRVKGKVHTKRKLV